MERRQNARAFVKQWHADPVLPFSADVQPAAVGKRDKLPSLFRCVGGAKASNDAKVLPMFPVNL
jgi:hypothetical protein